MIPDDGASTGKKIKKEGDNMRAFKTPEEFRNFVATRSDEELEYLLTVLEKNDEHRKPKLLKVAADERAKIDEIFRVFQSYIDEHYFFDIFFSKKYGYYRLDKDGEHDQFNTADGIFDCLIFEFSNDVRALQIGGPHMKTSMRPEEETELRKRMTPYIEKLSDREHYFGLLDGFIERFVEAPPEQADQG